MESQNCQTCSNKVGKKPVPCIRASLGCKVVWCSEDCRRKKFSTNHKCIAEQTFKYNQPSPPIVQAAESMLSVNQLCSYCKKNIGSFVCCNNIVYCSKSCQNFHHFIHKTECVNNVKFPDMKLEAKSKLHIYLIATQFVVDKKIIELFNSEEDERKIGPIYLVENRLEEEEVLTLKNVQCKLKKFSPQKEKNLKKKLRYVEKKDNCIFFVFLTEGAAVTYTIRLDKVFRTEKNLVIPNHLITENLEIDTIDFELLLNRLMSGITFSNRDIFTFEEITK